MPGQFGGAVLQRQPVKPDKTAPLTLNIRIASSQNVVENADLGGPKKDLVKEISNDLRNQFLKHLQDRLAFLKSDKIKVSKDLNESMWSKGIQNPPRRITVKMVKDTDGVITISPAPQ